jgi:hypothetical protein
VGILQVDPLAEAAQTKALAIIAACASAHPCVEPVEKLEEDLKQSERSGASAPECSIVSKP